jgi:hypothetical protein
LRFLEEPETAEPINNRAERALRSAVSVLKVSVLQKYRWRQHLCCVLETRRKRGQSMMSGLVEILRSPARDAA